MPNTDELMELKLLKLTGRNIFSTQLKTAFIHVKMHNCYMVVTLFLAIKLAEINFYAYQKMCVNVYSSIICKTLNWKQL